MRKNFALLQKKTAVFLPQKIAKTWPASLRPSATCDFENRCAERAAQKIVLDFRARGLLRATRAAVDLICATRIKENKSVKLPIFSEFTDSLAAKSRKSQKHQASARASERRAPPRRCYSAVEY